MMYPVTGKPEKPRQLTPPKGNNLRNTHLRRRIDNRAKRSWSFERHAAATVAPTSSFRVPRGPGCRRQRSFFCRRHRRRDRCDRPPPSGSGRFLGQWSRRRPRRFRARSLRHTTNYCGGRTTVVVLLYTSDITDGPLRTNCRRHAFVTP